MLRYDSQRNLTQGVSITRSVLACVSSSLTVFSSRLARHIMVKLHVIRMHAQKNVFITILWTPQIYYTMASYWHNCKILFTFQYRPPALVTLQASGSHQVTIHKCVCGQEQRYLLKKIFFKNAELTSVSFTINPLQHRLFQNTVESRCLAITINHIVHSFYQLCLLPFWGLQLIKVIYIQYSLLRLLTGSLGSLVGIL